MNSQQTSSPYSLDVLQPHDPELVAALEFGTNVTADTGQPFNTQNIPTEDVRRDIEPRLGVLRAWIDSDAGDTPTDEPRGLTYEIPDWTINNPGSPALGDVPCAAFFAHVLWLDDFVGGPGQDAAALVLGGPGLVGNVAAEPFTSIGLQRNPSVVEHPLADGVLNTWDPGGGGGLPATTDLIPNLGQGAYVRMLAFYDPKADETELIGWMSRDGLSWTNIGFGEVPGIVRRVGVSLRGEGFVGLDWVRVYQWVVTNLSPIMPQQQTGGRLFVP